MTGIMPSIELRHHLEGQRPIGDPVEFIFVTQTSIELGTAGLVHAINVFWIPETLAWRIPLCRPRANHEAVVLGTPLLDIDKCWLWLPLERNPGLIHIEGESEVTARADDEKILGIGLRIWPDCYEQREGEDGNEPNQRSPRIHH